MKSAERSAQVRLEGNAINHANDVAHAARRQVDVFHGAFNLVHQLATVGGNLSGVLRVVVRFVGVFSIA